MKPLPPHAVGRLQREIAVPEIPGGRFTIQGLLGRGGMGSVWLARDEELGREVAIKVTAQPLSDEASQARLLAEARILARLEHPGIVPVHDAGLLPDGCAWYAMKRVRGRRLDEHAGPGTPLGERLRIFERLCETLAFAHAAGVVHRDLKPGNVMAGEFGEVLVLDWGVAKILGEQATEPSRDASPAPAPTASAHTAPGTVMGTPGFMAPEQADGRSAEADARTDVYGLGALLHVLLFGAAPPSPLPAGPLGPAPAALQAICRKALAPRPEDRYASAVDLRQDLARFREGEAVTALPEGPLRWTLRLLGRHRVAVALVLAYLVMRAVLALGFGR